MITTAAPHFSSILTLKSILMRRAIRMVVAVFIGSCLFLTMHKSHGFWIPLTVTIIMQSTIGGTLRKGMQRLIGTIGGIIAAALVLYVAPNSELYSIIMVFAVFCAYYLKAYNAVSYGVFVAPITMVILLLLASIHSGNIISMMGERIADTLIAAAIVFICSYLILPNTTRDEAGLALNEVSQTLHNCILLMADRTVALREYNQKIMGMIENHQRIWPEWIYETYFSPAHRAFYQQVVLLTDKGVEILVALNWYMHRLSEHNHQELLVSSLKEVAKIFEVTQTSQVSISLPALQVPDDVQHILIIQTYLNDLNDVGIRLHQLRQQLDDFKE